MKPANPYLVAPVTKALRVLDLVAQQGHALSLTEVASRLALPKTTTFRYLQTLAEAGFISHDRGRDRYGVGPRFRALAAADDRLQAIVAAARSAMRELRRRFNETINLGVRAGAEIVYVRMVEANRSLRMQARVGQRHPLHSTALGKAILAFLPDAERDELLAGPLAEMTARTVTDRAQLAYQLRRARDSGYATEIEENEDGAMCIGAAILDGQSYPIAALSLAAPKFRMSRRASAQIGGQLLDSARIISGVLAGRPPARPQADGASAIQK